MIEIRSNVSLSDKELNEICKWISDSKDLSRISSLKRNILSKKELKKWISESIVYSIAKHDNLIVGICTLTRKEATLKKNEIEMCHLIVHPDYRRKYNGSGMLLSLIEEARKKNYTRIVGRVVKDNMDGKGLLLHLNWLEIDNISNEENVIWHECVFPKNKFKNYLFKRMSVLNLNAQELGDLVGVSKQYINGLKNPLIGKTEKLPSPRLLRDLGLILGQTKKSTFDSYFKYKNKEKDEFLESLPSLKGNLIKRKEKESEWLKLWPKKWSYPKYLINIEKDKSLQKLIKNAKTEYIYELLIIIGNLREFRDKIIYVDNTLTKHEIINRINQIEDSSLDKVNDDYEIWTISDIFGEQIHPKSIDEVANNILKYRIKYKYFTSFDDSQNWKVVFKKLKENIKQLYISNIEYYSKYWNAPFTDGEEETKFNVKDYISFYGLPSSMLFFRIRIYNAKSRKASGNINLGGSSRSDVSFVDIGMNIIEKIKQFIPKIFTQEQLLDDKVKTNHLDDIEINIRSENVTVSKKYPNKFNKSL